MNDVNDKMNQSEEIMHAHMYVLRKKRGIVEY